MKYILLTLCLFLTPMSRDASAADAPAKPVFSGKVTETMDAASYTYVQIDTGSKKIWAAAPRFGVKVGDTIQIADPMEMRDYHSKALNRDFPSLYFTGGVTVNGKPAEAPAPSSAAPAKLPEGHPPIGGNSAAQQLPPGHPEIGGGTAKSSADFSKIKKAQGGRTIAEIYADKSKLNGKSTAVRGKVVKYNAMIMGKNWVHIQDGTGAVGSNDLLVTSATEVKVGDTVLVSGKISVDKDFGAGYKFSVMIEDAKIVVE